MQKICYEILKKVSWNLQLVTNAQLEESPLYVPLHPFEGHVFILNFHCISALLQTRTGFQIKSNVPQIVTETIQQIFLVNKIVY